MTEILRRRVKIKTWKQMEKEFGLTPDGDIDCEKLFTTDMEFCTPPSRKITLEYNYDLNVWRFPFYPFAFSEDMIAEDYDADMFFRRMDETMRKNVEEIDLWLYKATAFIAGMKGIKKGPKC